MNIQVEINNLLNESTSQRSPEKNNIEVAEGLPNFEKMNNDIWQSPYIEYVNTNNIFENVISQKVPELWSVLSNHIFKTIHPTQHIFMYCELMGNINLQERYHQINQWLTYQLNGYWIGLLILEKTLLEDIFNKSYNQMNSEQYFF